MIQSVPHVDLAKLCQTVYAGNPTDWEHLWSIGGITVGHARLNGSVDVLAFRGSLTAEDWFRDLLGMPIEHRKLGHVHAGFMEGMEAAYAEIAPLLGQWRVLTGHSLGAAHAWLFGGLLALDSKPAQQITVFGSPRPGFAKLKRIIGSGGSVDTSYRNRLDPVTYVPELGIPDVFDLFQCPADYTLVNAPPPMSDLEPLRDHHIALYLDGLQALEQKAA